MSERSYAYDIRSKNKRDKKKIWIITRTTCWIYERFKTSHYKWETDGGILDVTNLQELSKLFGITVDYLLNNDNGLPALSMTKELDKNKYNGKISSYSTILKEYYPAPWEVYSLIRDKKDE